MVEFLICLLVMELISKDFKVKKLGIEKALEKFKKKKVGPADMRL